MGTTKDTLDILDIRERLNGLPFRNGKRQVQIRRISDRFTEHGTGDEDVPETDGDQELSALQTATIEKYEAQLREQLSPHGLDLASGDNDPDKLFAVQVLLQQSKVDLSWMGTAMSWASRIMPSH